MREPQRYYGRGRKLQEGTARLGDAVRLSSQTAAPFRPDSPTGTATAGAWPTSEHRLRAGRARKISLAAAPFSVTLKEVI